MRPKVLLAVAAFTLGTAAPEGWTLEDNGEDHFRTSEVYAVEVADREPVRIATGDAHGPRGPVTYSPGLGSSFSYTSVSRHWPASSP